MKETIHNLLCDWDGILNWYGVNEEGKREIKKMVAYEVDCYKKMTWYNKLLNKVPEWNPFDRIK